jgi:thiamine-phosphate pyrophosphorylase
MSLAQRLPGPPVLVITDRHQAKRPLEEIATALFAAGCRWLSVREKDMPAGERRALLVRLVALGGKYGATVAVHGSITAARRILGPGALVGISAHSVEDVAEAVGMGADYATLSPIFPTSSKPGYGPALGLDILGCADQIPLLALGGVDAAKAASCIAAGAAGVAVMGEAMRAPDQRGFMADLLSRLPPRLVAS